MDTAQKSSLISGVAIWLYGYMAIWLNCNWVRVGQVRETHLLAAMINVLRHWRQAFGFKAKDLRNPYRLLGIFTLSTFFFFDRQSMCNFNSFGSHEGN